MAVRGAAAEYDFPPSLQTFRRFSMKPLIAGVAILSSL